MASAAAPRGGVLFLDMISQPCRAVSLFAALALPAAARPRVQLVLIGRGATRTPEFLALNPLGQVPLYVEERGARASEGAGAGAGAGASAGAGNGGAASFALAQSTSILRYLADAHCVDEHWLPRRDSRARARVDSLLDFYHAEMRPASLGWVYGAVIGPRAAGSASARDGAAVARAVRRTGPALAHLAARVAARDGIGDARAMTVADLLFACELSQFALLPPAGAAGATSADGAEAFAALLDAEERAALRPWMRDVEAACGEHWAAAHAVLGKLAALWRAKPLA